MAQLETAYRVDVNVQPALKSLKDFKKEIEADAIALAKLDKTSTEYDKAAADLAKKQEQLNEAVGLAKNANQAAEGSYAALQKQMTALRKEWRETGDVARRNELGVQINKLNDQLKVMDKSIGVFNRNVGNYTGSVVDAFRQIGGTAGGELANGVKTANTAFKMLATNPIGAVLTLLVPLIMKIASGFKSSEDNANAASMAFSGFKAVGDLVTRSLQGLAKGLGWVGQQFTNLLKFLGLYTERMQEREDIAAANIEITKKERENEVQNAKLSYEVSELRAKANEKLKYSAAERAKFLQEANDKEKQIAQNELDLAQMRYDIAVREQKLASNSKEANDELAAAQANLYRVKESYNQRTYRLQSQLNSALSSATEKAAKTQEDIEAESFAKRLEELDKFNKSWDKKERQRHEKAIEEQKAAFEKMRIAVPEGLQQINDEANDAYQTDLFNKRMAEEAKQRLEEATFNVAKSSLDGMADLLEASAGENEKAVQAAKGLRAASATMDAFAAANSAYNAMASIPVVGPALGVAAAAAALASGIANVRQILATNTRTTNTASATTASVAASAVQAPAVIQEVAATRTLTTSTQEQQLNRMASDTRVYVVESDIAQAGKKVSVREGESVFR